jgi:hypothetical protein
MYGLKAIAEMQVGLLARVFVDKPIGLNSGFRNRRFGFELRKL